MTVQTTLKEGQSILFYAEVETPMLDAVVLLSEALGITKEKMLSSLPEEVDGEGYEQYRHFIDMRCSGLPVSYIRRKKEFFSLEFFVDERVLVPRPDTERLVEEAITVIGARPDYKKIHDVCTGSGCIAITLKYYIKNIDISASDISPKSREVFQINTAAILGEDIPFYLSDLLKDVPGKFDLITANPPYLTDKEVDAMNKISWPEPDLSLRGGSNGTSVIRRLIGQAAEKLAPGGTLLIETDSHQVDILSSTLEARGFRDLRVFKDLSGRDRVLKAEV